MVEQAIVESDDTSYAETYDDVCVQRDELLRLLELLTGAVDQAMAALRSAYPDGYPFDRP